MITGLIIAAVLFTAGLGIILTINEENMKSVENNG